MINFLKEKKKKKKKFINQISIAPFINHFKSKICSFTRLMKLRTKMANGEEEEEEKKYRRNAFNSHKNVNIFTPYQHSQLESTYIENLEISQISRSRGSTSTKGMIQKRHQFKFHFLFQFSMQMIVARTKFSLSTVE